MTDKPRKKKSLAPLMLTLITFLLSGAGGALGAMWISSFTGDNDALFFVYLGLMLLSLVLAFLVHIVVHEGGHLIFGRATGYQFVSFNVMGFIWQKQPDGRVKLGRMKIAGAGGQCLMAPPPYNGGDFPFTLYNLGGVLMNLVLSGLCALLAWLIPAAPVKIVLAATAVVGVFTALMNGLPLPVAAIQNDATNLICIRRDANARQAFWAQMSVAAATAQGVRIKDMPQAWFAEYSDKAMNNPIICAVAVMNTSRLMDGLQFTQAEEAIRTLLQREKGVLGLYRAQMACDGAVCELLAGRPGTLTALTDDKEIQQIMTAMKAHPTILRTRYALALLRDHDADKAAALLADFEAAAHKHPNAQEITGERELIAAIQQAAEGNA